jgi:hypothetical protein
MQLRKKYLVLAAAMIAAALIAALFWMRLHGAPESIRLLPDSSAVGYANLTPLRLANVFASLKKVDHNPEYEDFIQQSGVDFERDLSEVAVAIHLPPPAPASGAAGAAAPSEVRFSWIFKGSFDPSRLSAYLRKISRSTEIYSGKEIFTVPVENRFVRVALLGSDKVAVSNVDGPEMIHQIVDRASSWWFLPAGPALVREHYKDVPFGSLVWVIAKPSSSGATSPLSLPGGFDVSLPAQITWIGSLRYAGSIDLEAQALTQNEEDARKVADTLGTLLSLFRSIQTNVGAQGPDPDVKNLFDSLQVTQEGNRTIITAEVPVGFIRKMAQQAPGAIAAKPAEPEPTPPQKKK